MKFLVLGASGALGTAIESRCKDLGHPCTSLNHNDVDICDTLQVEACIEKANPDVVVNCVAIIGINICETEPLQCMNVNAVAVAKLAQICERKGICLIQPSSHAVFDGEKDGYYTEDDQPNPINLYAASKYLSETLTINNCGRHYIVRLPTMFGERRNDRPGFVDKMLEKILRGESVKVPKDKIDSPSYTKDVATALINLAVNRKPFGIYHLANNGHVSYYDFIVKLSELSGSTAIIEGVFDKDFGSLGKKPLKTAMSSVKLDPMRGWNDALKDYVGAIKHSQRA